MTKNVVWWVVSIIFALALPRLCLSEDPSLPPGWRLPTTAETDQDWRNEDSNRYLVVRADFNGDGVTDQAKLLLRDTGPGFGLFAFVWQKDGAFKAYVLEEVKDTNYIEFMGIAPKPPGLYKTACGKGYFECGEGEPEEILLRHHAIDYFKEGSANSYFYWDEATETFKRVWISD